MSRNRAPHRLAAVLLLALFPAFLGATDAAAQPGFSKSFQPDTIGPGSTSQLVFLIDNLEVGSPADDLAFTDVLPASVAIANPSTVTSTCGGTVTAPAGGTTITLSGGGVAADSTCEVRVDVTSSTLGTFSNVSGDLTSNQGNSGPATDDLTVNANRPGFTKSFSPSTVQLGGRSTLTFTLDASAVPANISFASFSDTLPAGLQVADPANAVNGCGVGTFTAAPGATTVSYLYSFAGTFLTAGTTCTLSVDVVATGAGQQVNRSGELFASVVAVTSNVSSGFAVAALQVDVDPLALQKSFVDDPAAPGGTATLRFSITNFNRDSTATGIAFTDDLDATLGGLVATGLPASGVCGAGSTLSGTSVVSLTGGVLAAGETCTFDVALQVPAGATPGAYPNTTSTITGTVGGSPVVGAAATETLFVSPVPSLTKTFLSDPVIAGDPVVMRFELTNGSTTASLSGAGFTDQLSAFISGITAGDVLAVPAAGFCAGTGSVAVTSPGGVVTLNVFGITLGAGASCTFDVTLQIPPDAASALYTNTTSPVTGTVDGEAVAGAAASDSLSVVAAPNLSKDFVPPFVQAGDTAILELTLETSENLPAPATGIGFTDDLGAALTGLTAVSLPAAGFCGPGSTISGTSVLTVSNASLDPNDSCTFAVTVQVPAGAAPGVYTNSTSDVTATVDGLAVSGAGGSADLTVVALELRKSFVDDPAVAGGTVELAFTIQNFSPDTGATAISFSDDLGSVLTGLTSTGLPQNDVCGVGSQLVQAGDTLFLTGGSVAAASSCSFSVTLQVPVGTDAGVYGNLTSALQADFGGSPLTAPPAADSLQVIDPLSITKSFVDDPVAPGDTVILELTLANASPTDAATALTFTDDLDAALSGLVATVLPANGFCGVGSTATGSSVLTVTGASLPAAGSCTFQVVLTVPAAVPAGTTVVNTTSSLSGLVGGVSVTAPPASDVLRIDQVGLVKSFAGPVGAGTTVVLSFEVRNRGAAPVSDVAFTDDLDAVLPGLVAVGLPATDVCGAGSTLSGTSFLSFSGGTLGAGASCTFDVTLQVPAGASPGSYLNTTSNLLVQGLVVGTRASDTLVVEPAPLFAKAFAPTTVAVENPSTLTFTIDNSAATVAATNLAFLDAFPAGLVVADPANASTTCTGGTITAVPGSGSVSYGGGSVAAGASCTVQVDVTSAAGNTYLNTSADLTSSLGNSGPASASVGFVARALAFEKRFVGTAASGGTVVLELVLTNTGGEAITNIAFTDDLDAVIPGLEAVGLPQADPCGAGSQLSGTSVLSFTGGSLAPGADCTLSVTLQLPDDLGSPPYENVTSPVTWDSGGISLEGPSATAVLEVSVLAIPTLSFWGLLLLAALMGVLGWWRLR